MFDIGWSELLVIGVVLIVVVGPKDLPKMLRTFGRTTTQLRKMAGDFRKQFDDALREAEMDDVRSTVDDLRSLNPAETVRKAMNPMRAVGDEIRSSLMAATKAPEPTIPSATAPASPAAEPGAAPSAEPSVVGTDEMRPIVAPAAMAPAPAVAAVPAAPSLPSAVETPAPTPPLNGTGHVNGAHREGEAP